MAPSEVDLRALEDAVTHTRQRTIAGRSRDAYRNSTVRFVRWMVQFKRCLVPHAFLASLEFDPEHQATKASVTAALDTAPENPPIRFERTTARDFMTWVLSMKADDGGYHVLATYAGHRSAFFNLFRDYHQSMSPELKRELSHHFRGLRNQIADAVGNGEGKVEVGKAPMTVAMLSAIATGMLQSESRDMVFARTCMLLCWNLMSRATNTTSFCYSHIAWGIYWATYSIDSTDCHLFPGHEQYDRFRKALRRALLIPSVRRHLEESGKDSSSIGTHSLRKGAATFASSGSTACPSAVAVHLRAGWTMGGVQDRYLRYDAAGDMFVGRTVSALPIGKPEFAVLPPHFVTDSDLVVRNAVRICFPGLPAPAALIGEYALASLVYHSEFLTETLPSAHPLLETPIFRQIALLSTLRSFVQCGATSDRNIVPTGIPPHVTILQELAHLRQTVERQQDQQVASNESLVKRVVDGVTNVIEERECHNGVPTCDRLAATVMRCLRDAGVLRREEPDVVPSIQNDDDVPASPATFEVYTCGGGLPAFPQNVRLPDGSPQQAWEYRCCGVDRLPPFRTMKSPDLMDRNQRKRLSDLRHLMSILKARAVQLGLRHQGITADEALTEFEQCKDAIEVDTNTPAQRKRRRGQLVWITVTTLLRKRARTANQSHPSS
ncbi:TPA: hypothetical protein N0F65_000716 [Lagenidium giganteum]|uniref:Uncharacterized protein n=1 Tax=Lagenidium giganteum TaxID=4803 RepID=A0AAV2ZKU8_9STRA|nr:TPA: hypothetical protein N0F65_000716 [Lagenidium giganteum]